MPHDKLIGSRILKGKESAMLVEDQQASPPCRAPIITAIKKHNPDMPFVLREPNNRTPSASALPAHVHRATAAVQSTPHSLSPSFSLRGRCVYRQSHPKANMSGRDTGAHDVRISHLRRQETGTSTQAHVHVRVPSIDYFAT